jgi:hypothetical protein
MSISPLSPSALTAHTHKHPGKAATNFTSPHLRDEREIAPVGEERNR